MNDRGVSTFLRTGEAVYLRPIGAWDRARETQIISRFSDHSRYLRFFTGARTIPEAVIDRLVDVDGHNHIAWAALDLNEDGAPFMGVVRAIRRAGTDEADLAMGVLDRFHGKGLARLLMTAVVHDARAAGITRFTAETLSENMPARSLFKAIGGQAAGRDISVVRYAFDAETVAARLDAISKGGAAHDLRAVLGPRRRAVSLTGAA